MNALKTFRRILCVVVLSTISLVPGIISLLHIPVTQASVILAYNKSDVVETVDGVDYCTNPLTNDEVPCTELDASGGGTGSTGGSTGGTTGTSGSGGTTGTSGSGGATSGGSSQGGPTSANLTPVGKLDNPTGKAGINTICDFIDVVLNVVAELGAIVAVLFIIWSGFLFIKAQGNKAAIQTAKSTFYTTIIGTAILVGASIITKVIVHTIGSVSSAISGSSGGGICS